MARVNPIPRERMTPEQRRVTDDISRMRTNATLRGPHGVWIHTPEVAALVAPMLHYLRNEAPIPLRLSALAILTAARAWTAQYAWFSHEKRARQGGLDPAVIEAIKNRRTPVFANEDEAAVYALTMELLDKRSVSDATYARALAALGEETLLYLTSLIGCYMMVAVVLTTFQVDVPPGETPPLSA
jgi:4-carboxymuconolactone decarboxylase